MPSTSCARTSRISRDGSTRSTVLVNEAAYPEGDNGTCSRNLADLNVALIDGLRWEGYTRKVFGPRHVNVSAPQHGRTDEDDCDVVVREPYREHAGALVCARDGMGGRRVLWVATSSVAPCQDKEV
jgi:hypothetical protein